MLDEDKIKKLSKIEKIVFSKYLEEEEKVFYIIHKHFWFIWISLFKRILIILFLQVLKFMSGLSFFQDRLDSRILMYISIGIIFFDILVALSLFLAWYNWYSDVFIMTDKNIVFVDWESLVKIRSSRISYDEVESASVEMTGFAATFFKFGDLMIETANEGFAPKIKGAAKAHEGEKQILMWKEKYSTSDVTVEAEIFKKALKSIIGDYLDEREKEKDLEKKVLVEVEGEDIGNGFKRIGVPKNQEQELEDNLDEKYSKYRIKDVTSKIEVKNKEDKKVNARFKKYRFNKEKDKLDDKV